MLTNKTREKLKAGEPCIGVFLGLGSETAAELLAHVGFDYLVIETEHNALDVNQIQNMLMAMKGTQTTPVVRVPSSDPVFIQRSLDIGAMGIMVPNTRTAADALAIVRATRYPPVGSRNFGGLRAGCYTMDDEDYFKRANENILVILIVETREAIDNLEAIAAVPGVDALFFGPMDLTINLGLNPIRQRAKPYPELEVIYERGLSIGKKHGVAIGVSTPSNDLYEKRKAQGYTFFTASSDYSLLLNAARARLIAFAGEELASRGRHV